MSSSEEKFRVKTFAPLYKESDNIGDDRVGALVSERQSFHVTHAAQNGLQPESRHAAAGHFTTYLGAMRVICPTCNSEGMVSLRPLLAAADGARVIHVKP